MSILIKSSLAHAAPDYEFATPEGLLRTAQRQRVLILKSQQEKDYMSGLALLSGLDSKLFTRKEWDAIPWEHQPVFKWFVDLGEFSP